MSLPKTKREAIASGQKHYMTGKPCNRGHVDKRNLWGKCLSCDADNKRNRRSEDPESVRAVQRERYAKKADKCRQQARESYYRNIEKKRAYERTPARMASRNKRVANWRDKNPEYMVNYREKNRDRERSRSREYWRLNPDKSAKLVNERRARLLQRTIKLSPDLAELNKLAISEAYELSRIRQAQTGICWHVDHIVPMKAENASGLHVYWNLQVVPASYNRRKHNKITNPLGWLHDDLL